MTRGQYDWYFRTVAAIISRDVVCVEYQERADLTPRQPN
jgi:hypothetical protein